MKQLSVILLLFVAAACGTASPPDHAADREAIATASAQFAAAENAGSVEQALAHFADDIVIMGPNTKAVTGADDLAALFQGFYDAFAVQVEYSNEEIVVFGDWGFDRGTYRHTLTPKAGGDPVHETGKYLWLYQRQAEGSWRQARVIWNSSDPPGAGGVQ